MTKWLYLDANDMDHLKRIAMKLDMVLTSPHDVMKSILGFETRRTGRLPMKIRVHDEVMRRLNDKARELDMKTAPIGELLYAISKLEDQDDNELGLGRWRPGMRPPTRRR